MNSWSSKMPAVVETVFGPDTIPRQGDLAQQPTDVVNIQGYGSEIDLRGMIAKMVNPMEGPRALPTRLLHDEKGLQLLMDVCLDPYSYLHKG